MRSYRGRVIEIRAGESIGRSAQQARIACPAGAIPAAGQYLRAWDPADGEAALAHPVFAEKVYEDGFLSAPPAPAGWTPGTRLELRGPLGRGFHLPAGAKRLALAALGEGAGRLMPLARQALSAGGDVTFCADFPLAEIPSAIEFHPLAALAEILSWADFLAVDIPLGGITSLRSRLGLPQGVPLPCPGQILVWAPMPCAGLAGCGVCATPVRRGWKLACEDGPVFALEELIG
jgi:NAD(P)H-flavin reductase